MGLGETYIVLRADKVLQRVEYILACLRDIPAVKRNLGQQQQAASLPMPPAHAAANFQALLDRRLRLDQATLAQTELTEAVVELVELEYGVPAMNSFLARSSIGSA